MTKYDRFIKKEFSFESNRERLKIVKGYDTGKAYCSENWAKRLGLYPLIQSHSIKKILDIGCGDGSFCIDMVEMGAEEVYGLDIASVVMGLTRESSSVKFIDGEAKNIPLADNAVEFVTAFDVLEHVLPKDVDKVIEEMTRVASKGMLFSIDHKLSGEEVDGVNMHMCVENSKWWVDKLSQFWDVKVLNEKESQVNSQILCINKRD